MHECADHWLERYQTLITGIFALIAALFGFRAVQAQIASTERMERERRTRTHTAAKATLPLQLSEVIRYCRKCHERLEYKMSKLHGQKPDLVRPPNFPRGAIPVLSLCIETAEDPGSFIALINLLQQLRTVVRADNLSVYDIPIARKVLSSVIKQSFALLDDATAFRDEELEQGSVAEVDETELESDEPAEPA